jgi:hypothetical protein
VGFPWFKIYAAETLSDENFQGWDVTERGAWFTLLLVAWREGSIPGDQGSLAKLLHLDGSAMRQVWSAIGSRFVPHPDYPGRLTSPRLEMEREEADRLSKRRSSAGEKGANTRWAKVKQEHGKRMRLPKQVDGKSIANHSAQTRTDTESEQIQTTKQDRLAGLRKRLGDAFGAPMPLGLGKDPDGVVAFFEAQLAAVGEDAVVADCLEAARRAGTIPAYLSWFPGWLQHLPLNVEANP